MTTPREPIDCDAVRDLAPLFVTGALAAAEADAVREHLAGCDDPHLELLEFGEAATALLETIEPVEPPAALKARLLSAAAADLHAGRHPSVAVAAPTAEVVSLAHARARRRPALAWLAAAAAVIVAVALGGWGLGLRGQLADAQAYQDGVDAALVLAAQPGSVTAVLVTEDGAPAGIGVVGADGSLRLALRGLTPTSGTEVYTAWGIAGDGAPVPLADLRVGSAGTAAGSGSSPVAQAGMVLAITLEPAGGAKVPTLPIVASGVAGTIAG